jgi:hypothetical protein
MSRVKSPSTLISKIRNNAYWRGLASRAVEEGTAVKQRHRFKQEMSLSGRLMGQANRCREQASRLPPGRQRDVLLEKARQADTVAHLNDWINSPGQHPPE